MSSAAPQPRPRKRSRTLGEDLVADISQRIRSGEIKPGDKLPTESAIMAEQGVSRTVVREAISRLQAAGLVETRHGIGTFVINTPGARKSFLDPSTITTLLDVIAILELRISLEVEASGLAAQRRTDKQLADMEQALRNLQHSELHNGDAVSADFQFHLLIAQATDNHYFYEIFSHLGKAIIPRTRLNTARLTDSNQTEYLARVNREHEEIYTAIARKDSDAARAAMRLHLTNSAERLRNLQKEAESRTT